MVIQVVTCRRIRLLGEESTIYVATSFRILHIASSSSSSRVSLVSILDMICYDMISSGLGQINLWTLSYILLSCGLCLTQIQ